MLTRLLDGHSPESLKMLCVVTPMASTALFVSVGDDSEGYSQDQDCPPVSEGVCVVEYAGVPDREWHKQEEDGKVVGVGAFVTKFVGGVRRKEKTRPVQGGCQEGGVVGSQPGSCLGGGPKHPRGIEKGVDCQQQIPQRKHAAHRVCTLLRQSKRFVPHVVVVVVVVVVGGCQINDVCPMQIVETNQTTWDANHVTQMCHSVPILKNSDPETGITKREPRSKPFVSQQWSCLCPTNKSLTNFKST